MTEELTPDEHQREDRAQQAKAFADVVEQQNGNLTLTLKGEAIEINKIGQELVVIANGDKTFSIKTDPSHLIMDEMLMLVLSA